MRRLMLALWMAIGPVLVLAALGCHKEIRTHSEREEIRESPPQMVSPGEPIVE